VLKLSLSHNKSRRRIEDKLDWSQINCAHTVENAVTVVDTAGKDVD